MEKTPETLAWVAKLLADKTKKVVFHKAQFDLKMFSFEGIDIFNLGAEVHCTLILSKLFNMNGSHSLRDTGVRYLSRDAADKDEIEEWVKANNRPKLVRERGRKANFSDAPIDMVERRCLWDVETTLLLYTFFHPRVTEYCADLYEQERGDIFATMSMELTGVLMDLTRARELRAKCVHGIERIKRELDKLLCPLTFKRKKKGVEVEDTVHEFNPNSALQMVAAFEKMGIELKYRTKPKKGKKGRKSTGGGNWAFDEYAMIRYVSRPLAGVIRDSGEEGWAFGKFYNEVVKVIKANGLSKAELLPPLVLKARELSKLVSTYYDHFLTQCVDRYIGPDGREYGTLHCSFNQNEALTGRYSSSNPNLQNMPRNLGPRECFVPRRGRRNWHFDYDQVEMKFFVHFARDPVMAKAIKKDIHATVASRIYRVTLAAVTKERRKRAKGINFGIIYGAGPPRIAETLTQKGLPTTTLEAAQLTSSYHREFPKVRRVTAEFKKEIVRKGYLTNPFGRRYHIRSSDAYKGLNYNCQGTSADLMKKGLLAVYLFLKQGGYKSRLILTIHDEIVVEMPRCEEAKLVPAITKLLEDRHSFYVPITVGVECVNRRWSHKISSQEAGLKLGTEAA